MTMWDIPNRFPLNRLYPRFSQRCDSRCDSGCAPRCVTRCEPHCVTRCDPECITECAPRCVTRCEPWRDNRRCDPRLINPCAGEDITLRVVGTDECGNLILCVKRPRMCQVNGDWVPCRRFF